MARDEADVCVSSSSVLFVAMNPVDHPHGGGEGRTSGGRPSVTPWGVYTKGTRTLDLSEPNLRGITSARIT